MPDMNTLKITYLSETPLKIADVLLIVSIALLAIYLIYYTIKEFFIKKDEKDENCDDSMSSGLLILTLYLIFYLYLLFGFTAPYADVYVQVIPNMDIREFDMNHSRDFIKKGDDYYFVKTIRASLVEKSHAEKNEEGLSDVIKWNIECSVSGTKGGDN